MSKNDSGKNDDGKTITLVGKDPKGGLDKILGRGSNPKNK